MEFYKRCKTNIEEIMYHKRFRDQGEEFVCRLVMNLLHLTREYNKSGCKDRYNAIIPVKFVIRNFDYINSILPILEFNSIDFILISEINQLTDFGFDNLFKVNKDLKNKYIMYKIQTESEILYAA